MSVAWMESVRLLLVLAVVKGWDVHHLDVKSTLELVEEVYVQQPSGFTITGKEHRVLRLRKALYGLRQAPRAWNAKLDTALGALGFARYTIEHALYTRQRGKKELIIGVYVDDLTITGACADNINSFKCETVAQFRMSDLGELSYYLGIEVYQGKDALTLCQSAYAGKMLERSIMADCKPCAAPMEERLKLTKTSTVAKVDATLYQSIVSGLRYLVHTRPDAAFVVGYVSRFMEDPRKDH